MLALGRIVKLCMLCCLLASYRFPTLKVGRRSRTVVRFVHYRSERRLPAVYSSWVCYTANLSDNLHDDNTIEYL